MGSGGCCCERCCFAMSFGGSPTFLLRLLSVWGCIFCSIFDAVMLAVVCVSHGGFCQSLFCLCLPVVRKWKRSSRMVGHSMHRSQVAKSRDGYFRQ